MLRLPSLILRFGRNAGERLLGKHGIHSVDGLWRVHNIHRTNCFQNLVHGLRQSQIVELMIEGFLFWHLPVVQLRYIHLSLIHNHVDPFGALGCKGPFAVLDLPVFAWLNSIGNIRNQNKKLKKANYQVLKNQEILWNLVVGSIFFVLLQPFGTKCAPRTQ